MENMSKRFIPVNDSGSGCLLGYFECSYKYLVRLLGKPNAVGDGYKISTQWNLRDEVTGNVFRIYDYKETNLYDRDLPSVRKFRSKEQHQWHIGGTNAECLAALKNFLNKKS